MNEDRIGLYLELIQELLSCPNGKEPEVLQAHRELWDEGLVLTLQAVAGQLQGNGQENEAGFLLSLAEQLAEALGMRNGENTELDSFSFLMQVLQKVSGSYGNPQVVYPFLAKNIDKLNNEFCQSLQQWGTETLQTFAPEQARSIAATMSYFGDLIQQFPGGDRGYKLEIAIISYKLALIVFTLEFNAELWATIQNDLGITYKDRINGSLEENLEISIQHYQAALTVRTREAFPQEWAETQYNLGNTYIIRIKGNPADNQELALNSYQLALTVFTIETSPKFWAMANTNLGATYIRRIKEDEAENLELAIKPSLAALTVHTFEVYPTDWAIAQKNLSSIYIRRTKGNRVENLERAIEFCQAALTVYTPDTYPQEWKEIQHNLAAAFHDMIDMIRDDLELDRDRELIIKYLQAELNSLPREVLTPEVWAQGQYLLANAYSNRSEGEHADNLEQAIKSYEAALSVYTLEEFPEQCATTQKNLAITYNKRIKGGRAENLERVIEYYQAALTFYTRDTFSEDWARIQNSLAVSYSKRIRDNRSNNLERAISLHQEVLTLRTYEKSPENWAETQNNLANVYLHRIKGEIAKNLEIAISLYQANLRGFTPTAFPEDWAMTQTNLGVTYNARIKGDRAENLEEAIKFHEAALTIRTREAFPEDWAETQHSLANVYSDRIKGKRVDNLEKAIEIYNAALTIRTRVAFPQDWAETQNNLALVYNRRIKGDRVENLEQAIKLYQDALTVFTDVTFPEQWAMTKSNLAAAYTDRIKGKRSDNLELAIKLYQESLNISTKEVYPQDWARVQHNLANAYRDRIEGELASNFELAIRLYQESLSIRTHEAFPEKWAQTQNNLALAYERRGKIRREGHAEDIEQAILCYENTLSVYTSTKFPEDWARIQNNLANTYGDRINGSRSENFKLAIKLYENALTIYKRAEFPLDYARTLSNFGTLYYQDQQWQSAYDLYARAIETVDFLRGESQSEENKQKLAEEWNRLYIGMVEVCIALKLYSEAVEYAERSKGQNLIELLSVKDLYPKGEIPAEVRQKLQHLKNRIYEEAQRLKQAPEKNYDSIVKLREEHAALYPYNPLKFAQIQELAPAHTAILEWYILDDSFCVFAITNNSQPRVLSFPKSDLDKLIAWAIEYLKSYRNYRNEVSNEWRDNLSNKLETLAEILHIDEILQTLPENTKQLILIPHRYLHLFPLHALPITKATWQHFHSNNETCPLYPYVLDCFEQGVRYTPSCQLLHQVQKYPQRPFNNLFAIQTPTEDLHDKDYGVTNAIKQQFNNPVVINKEQATKSALIQENSPLLDTHCLFFYCHGYFDSTSPLESGLQLADGNLTVSDIIAHFDLRNCRLVTLSACETGQTQIDNTDEYIGLPSGFMLAGSQNLVGTLWSVNALATSLLMTKFYTELQKSDNIALALNQSQKWLRDATVKGLQDWLPTSPLEDEWREKLTKTLQEWETFPGANYQPFNSPAYWAAFCAIGKGT